MSKFNSKKIMTIFVLLCMIIMTATPFAVQAAGESIGIVVAVPGDAAAVTVAVAQAEVDSGISAGAMTEVTVTGAQLDANGLRQLSTDLPAMEILHMPGQLAIPQYWFFGPFSGHAALREVDMPLVVTLASQSFSNCPELTTVNLPAATNMTGSFTFEVCPKLTSIHMPALISSGSFDFYLACTSLTEVNFPELTTLGICAFGQCTSLSNVSLPKVSVIKTSAFSQCTSLASLTLPASVTSIENGAFKDSSITDLIFWGDIPPTFGTQIFGSNVGPLASNITIWVPNNSAQALYTSTLVPSQIPTATQIKVLTSAQLPTGISISSSALTLYTGQKGSLTATVAGTPTDPSYGWTCDNPSITAITGDGKLIATKAGTATVTATSNMNPSLTDTCFVTVVGSPSISVQPNNDAVTVGNTASFTISAVDAVSYQWQMSTDSGITWNDVTTGIGGTSVSYTTANVVLGDNGKQYRCVVSNPAGTVSSNPATLTVNTAPNPPAPSVTCYTVSFNTNGGSAVASQSIKNGDKLTKPADPTREKYTFTGWYTDQACTKAYDFDKKVTSAFTLYAGWKWANPFTDVKTGDWFYSDVEYVHLNSLFEGTSKTKFSPGTAMDRSMIVTVLGRLSGDSIPQTGFNIPFTDVSVNHYAAPYIAWASEHGIVKGFTANTFGPYEGLTREQIAEILYRYAVYKGKAPSEGMQEKLKYPDANSISSWAQNGAIYCQKHEIIKGNPDGSFNPQGNATRAEVAAILHRFAENVK